MNLKIDCGTCSSADPILEEYIAELGRDTAHHRIKNQEIKCGFGLQGLCCRLCANGPCRITPRTPKGVCGADSDVIVARNFLRTIAGGSASYLHIAENSAWNLKRTGENKGNIKGIDTLNSLAKVIGLPEDDPHTTCINIANKVLDDLYKPRFEQMELVDKLSYQPRINIWNRLGIKPGGAKSEVFDALVKTSTNLNSDPVNMLLHGLKLGISTGVYGLTLTNLLNDIMLGEPQIRQAKVGFNVINKNYINIMVTGHQHSLIGDLQDALVSEGASQIANSVGANGFRIIGSTCVGQDLQARAVSVGHGFSGHAGNNFVTEPLVATGAIDLVVSEFNCTLPGMETIANDLDVKMICLDDVAKKSSADFIQYSYKERKNISSRIIKEAVASYQRRRGKVVINLPDNHGNDTTITGLAQDSLRDFLGGSYEPLINLISLGQIKGIAAIVGCSNLVSGGHDVFTVELAKEMIKRDIIVLSAGCTSGGLENAGLMSPDAANLAGSKLRNVCKELGIPPVLNFGPCLAIGRLEGVATEIASLMEIDLPKLPLVMSAPQWLEEQALADGTYALALGLPIHLAKSPYISGSPVVVNTLTQGIKNLTGGQLIIDDDVKSTADTLEDIILARRKALSI